MREGIGRQMGGPRIKGNTKLCPKCKNTKPLSDFYWVRSTRRISSSCKICCYALTVRSRAKNPGRDKKYEQNPSRKANLRKYYKKYYSTVEAKMKRAASTLVRYKVRRGELQVGPCEVCGATDVHGHHDDYSKPLEVRWLCPKHHKEVHRKINHDALLASLQFKTS